MRAVVKDRFGQNLCEIHWLFHLKCSARKHDLGVTKVHWTNSPKLEESEFVDIHVMEKHAASDKRQKPTGGLYNCTGCL